MSQAVPEALRAPVIALARRAGAAILDIYRSDFAVAHKADRSPLTEADMAAHRIIEAGLAALTPAVPMLSEESAALDVAQRRSWNRYWLVDPLDGTREFVKRNGEFTVNIALIEDGTPLLGVVFAPDSDYLCHAVRGHGAVLEQAGHHSELRVQPRSSGALRVAGSRSHGDPRLQLFLDRIGEHELVAMGSSLKFCLIAAGDADLYLRLGPTSEWDTAAGQCVLEEAGGRVSDLNMNPLTYNRRDTLLNPDFLAAADPERDWRPYL